MTPSLREGYFPPSWNIEANNPGITKHRKKQARKRARDERRGLY